ncbi:MAG: tRNA lysidine(34) synthetase TilS, partial [Gammaproteobacteria bacterium]
AAGGVSPGTLALGPLKTFSPARQRNVLRYWLRHRGLAVPPAAVLGHILQDMAQARSDAGPLVRWNGGEVRRYRDQLYALSGLPAFDAAAEFSWQPAQPLDLPSAVGTLEALPTAGAGLAARFALDGGLRVRFRRGGEMLRPSGRTHRRALKKLFQEAGVPPWERERIPLVYVDGELGAVAGFWVCDGFQAMGGEPGLVLRWSRWGQHA